jgi:hypothetical protein
VELQHTRLAQWPYPQIPPDGSPERPPDDGQPHHLPGSTKTYTMKEVDGFSAVDWFPEAHLKAPAAVIDGKPGVYRPCGACHLMDGYGKPDMQIGSAKWIRVVETEAVPKTMLGRHSLLALDPSGAKEPVGNRILALGEFMKTLKGQHRSVEAQ